MIPIRDLEKCSLTTSIGMDFLDLDIFQSEVEMSSICLKYVPFSNAEEAILRVNFIANNLHRLLDMLRVGTDKEGLVTLGVFRIPFEENLVLRSVASIDCHEWSFRFQGC